MSDIVERLRYGPWSAELKRESIDEIERLQAELREARADAYDAYTAGYLDGFKASGEGWNGEFPFEGEDPQEDAHWTERRDEAFAAYVRGLAQKSGFVQVQRTRGNCPCNVNVGNRR